LRCAASYNLTQELAMKYRIVLHRSEEGFAVSVPGLPGCWSQGATEQEALDNIREAIREYLAAVEDEAKGQDVREIEVTP
jgi:predicted RNase H-like HicB family nuclease